MDGSQTWHVNAAEEDEYNTELVVHNFHPSLTKQGLRSQFLRYGHVESANVMTNSRGNPVGFIMMRTAGECDRAIAGLNGRGPLHWTVKMSAPRPERERRRREREEARRFEEEIRPLAEARIREMKEHQHRMMQLTQEFRDTLEAEPERLLTAEDAQQPEELNHSMGGGQPPPSLPELEGLRPCAVCLAPTPGYCQKCDTPYCSTECQHTDWPKHKHHCRREPPLVISVGGGDEPPLRSVCLGRGDQRRPAVPRPLRRPHASSLLPPSGPGGDGPPPPPTGGQASPPRQASPRRPGSGGGTGQGGTPPRAGQQQMMRQKQQQLLLLQKQKQQQQQQQRQQQQQQQQWQQLGAVNLRPGQHYSVVVCYAADPGAVNLRLVDQYDLVREMEEELGRRVALPAPGTVQNLETGQLCAARFDGSWYRGEVHSVTGATCSVHFIDWGNTDSIPTSSVAPLPTPLSEIPPQAVLAALPWRPAGPGASWSDRQWEGLRALDGQPLTASVVGTEPTVKVALFNEDGKSVLSVIGEAGGRVQEVVEAEQALPENTELEMDRKHIVVPCSMRHPQQVCAQLRDVALYRLYQDLVERLQTAAGSAAALSSIPPADSAVLVRCPAPLGGSPAWRRAAVQGRHGEQAVVRLLDWGGLETVPLAELRPLPAELCQTPAIGVEFGLAGVPESACSEEELGFYRERLIGKEFLLERVDSSGERTQARLHLLSDTNSFCFNDKMLSRIAAGRVGFPALPVSTSCVSPTSAASPQKRVRLTSDSSPGRPLELVDLGDPAVRPGDTHPFLLGQVLGCGRFFGSPLTEENTAAVERLDAELREVMAARRPPPCRWPLQPGQLVAVRAADDPDGWSRAAVVDSSGPEVLVRLLDVGFQERVSPQRLRPLPKEVTRLAPASLLLAFKGSDRWTAEQRRRAETLLRGDCEGEQETVLDLTVAAVGSAGTATLVTCAELGPS